MCRAVDLMLALERLRFQRNGFGRLWVRITEAGRRAL
jgi:hypothetical protein